ncbi:D-ribose ABC transporter substrate-binding protein [Fervidobacterium pennivorans subsp. shakshaketiis]|jgi:ribose transport system substrate-binding protein|uniref:Monosaccharide ABC transporter substrate-binding protein, CUT2 family n=1 Tax=Fervidobacterium pennivorans (strain DSM 9078 / Ven5) TaxID=771875 RepID=H9U9W4_FERPD|nr:D-ribose ABC transporter substrate-binding protein [Fervidobacterium pennivorans]AFG34307.1 monosaccharide ABC transporter substrate-binding protein, CUT2 family [Fervidobacterium pennivorans DSM 9078]QIV77669.1 D-ribose ABC transporter substrate-binding protein [Fervidobacterium pennivorans subsp. keratinolyticus]
MKRLVVVLAVLLLVVSAFSFRVGLSLSTLNNPFFVTLRDGALAAAKELGITLLVVDAQDKPAKQLNDIEDLIQKKVDLIIINPTDSAAIVPAIEAANKAKIPVITVDRAAAGGQVVVHIASDNVAGGAMAARFIAEQLKGKGKVVMLVGIPGTSAARDRGLGFKTELKKYPGIQLVAEQVANFNRAEGMRVMENILQAYPDIDAVFAQNDEMALGAIEAIRAAKKLGKIMVVGFDAIPDALEAVKKGEMAATVAQQPYLMGQLAVQKAYEYLKQKTIFIPVELELVTKGK